MNPEPKPPEKDNPPPQPKVDGLEVYNTVAETVGGVPSLRWKDNLFQGLAIAVSTVLGVLIGYLITFDLLGVLIGAFAGLVVGLFASGIVLMVLGWVRAAKFAQRQKDSRRMKPDE